MYKWLPRRTRGRCEKDVRHVFVKTIHKAGIKTFCLLVLIALGGAALLTWPQAVATGASRGLSICSGVLIPSLFPFLVLAGFLVRSGVSRALGRRLERFTRKVFGLPGCCAAGILVGFIGGYPAGGVAVGQLVEQGDITPRQGRRMLRFCVNAGPAFVISAVGAGMLGSARYGAVLFFAHIAASLLLGVGQRIWIGKQKRRPLTAEPPRPRAAHKPLPASAAFVESVNAACRSLLYMCGFVVLFASLLSLADVSGVAGFFQYLLTLPISLAGSDPAAVPNLFAGLLEVSCGCIEAASSGAAAPFLLGFIMGWGGLSVHCQLAASLYEYRLLDKTFFLFRLLHGVLAGSLSLLLFRFVPLPLEVFKPLQDAVVMPYATSAAASVALLLMCAMLLLTGRGRQKEIGGK